MGSIYWLTGLSGAGKSTLCEAARPLLMSRGLKVRIIDGDEVRALYPAPLGFEVEDVLKNNLNIATMAKAAAQEFDVVLIPAIAPYESVRKTVKEVLKNDLHFIYCQVALDEVIRRDVKGLYGRASRGEIKNMIGMNEKYPYEVPLHAEIVINTQGNKEESVRALVDYITRKDV